MLRCKFIILLLVPFPRIITHPTDTSAAAPFSAVFICSAQAYGEMLIQWEGKDNLPSPVQVSTPELTTSTLTIPNVTGKDAGTYYCVVWANRQGARSHAASLVFSGKPLCTAYLLNRTVVIVNAVYT